MRGDRQELNYAFTSDNYSGICPAALAAMNAANSGYACSYGNDNITARAADAVRSMFETDCEVFFVFNGTAANSLALSHLCRPYHSVVCSACAHIETDECGAPEFFTGGTKILLAGADNGKIVPAEIERLVRARTDIHYPKPKVISLTQSTECGTVYSVEELRAIHEIALRHRMRVHMDGARFANAVASLGVSPKEITWKVGVDVLCLGCTKNGSPVGDAVVFFDAGLAKEFDYRCKQAGQLASKMRYLTAPLVGMLGSGVWLRNAEHANAMAARVAALLAQYPQIRPVFPVEANAVFVEMPEPFAQGLAARGWHIYNFIGGAHRFMCSWQTAPEDIEALAKDLRELAG